MLQNREGLRVRLLESTTRMGARISSLGNLLVCVFSLRFVTHVCLCTDIYF